MKDGQASPPVASPQTVVVEELKGIIEQQKGLIEILSKQIEGLIKASKEEVSRPAENPNVKITQINSGKKRYFCMPEEVQAFKDANPDIKIDETFNLELPANSARGILNDPENKKYFVKGDSNG